MKDRALQAKIENEELVIRIGIGTNSFALENSNVNNPYREVHGEQKFIKWFEVVDEKELAEDVIREMFNEDEDGSTPLTRFFDDMHTAAIEQGSCAVEETNEYKMSRRA